MRYMAYILLTAAILCAASCGNDIDNPTPLPQEAEVQETAFAEGADISWVTQMESDGQRFYNAAGEERECTALMKEIGFDAIRLRVWVDPEEGWCGKG